MTDRELLEMAAKAAGIKNILWHDSDAGGWVRSLNGHPWWNPLTDDGDALRLAVALELEVYFGDDEAGTGVHVGYAADPDSASMVRYCIQPSNADPYAATRRAITRAAAEIGKGMP
jgi:hypothetical protein